MHTRSQRGRRRTHALRNCSLGVSGLLGIILCLLDSLASVLFVDAELADLSEDLSGGHLLGDLLRGLSDLALGLLEHVLAGVLVLGGGRFQLVGCGVSNITLLGLVSTSWEEDELALVAFKSLHIQLKSLF